ncbi:MAG: arginine--tRNA ligase [Clostridia bacterium]|nr:arginine--tRNA ligase [Clostridia bacterium]
MIIKQLLIKELKSIDTLYDWQNLVTPCVDSAKGDFTIVCFPLAKEFHKAPQIIATEIASVVDKCDLVDKCEVVNGYLNMFLDKAKVVAKIVECYDNGKLFEVEQVGKGKTAFIDFSSINLAKYMHMGHILGTAIGASFARILELVGFKTVRINYVGDSGTSFGKVIAGYEMWGNKDDVEARGVDALQELYVKFSREEEENPELREKAKQAFVRFENGDPEAGRLHKWFSEITINEAKSLFELMNIEFDDWRGEAYYCGKILQDSQELLMDSGIVEESQGAKIIDMNDAGLGVAIIEKSDGASSYLSRDICALEDRYAKYKFDKGFYETGNEQSTHFAQLFETMKRLNRPFAYDLRHISHGLLTLPTGKISSRMGKQAVLKDIFEVAINKSKQMLIDRNYTADKVEEISKAVGVSAVLFSVLKSERVKETVFDLERAISFDGETSPYIQYTYARAHNVIKKAVGSKELKDISTICNAECYELIKLLGNFNATIMSAYKDAEPCYISRYILSICKQFNIIYNQYRVINDDTIDTYRLQLCQMTADMLARGMKLLGITVIDVM